MNLTPITQRVVNTCNQVKGFVSAGKDPMVFSDAEAEKMLQRLRTVVSAKEEAVSFAEGQKVRISEGPFKDFIGTVDSVQGSRVKVMVSVFGRPTSVELNPRDLKKELDREKAPA